MTITIKKDVELDPKNSTYYRWRNSRRYSERLMEYDKNGNPYKSIIDCGQIWTIFKLPEDHPENELRWDRRYGDLEDTPMIMVEAALQVIIGSCIGFNRIDQSDPPYQAGDVLEMDLQSSVGDGDGPDRFLVVSSTSVDAIRERIMLRRVPRNRLAPLGHCTVVPLLAPPYDFDPETDRGVAEVFVHQDNGVGFQQKALALCFEPYTVNWYERNTEFVGSVQPSHIENVRYTLREHLDLPAIGDIK